MHLTRSFLALLDCFRTAFTAPSFGTLRTVLTGWLLTSRPRFVTECIHSGGGTHAKHFSCYHRLFSESVWSLDELFEALARRVVDDFVPTGAISVVIDDTLCHKRGLKPFGAGMHYDPLRSSKGKKATSWGHDWVTVSVLVRGLARCPAKVWALPVACRLYKNRQGVTKGKKAGKANRPKKVREVPTPPAGPGHKTRPELAAELLRLVAGWFPGRAFCAGGDSLYGGKSVARHLPTNVHLISRADAKAALYGFPPPRPKGKRGRPRKKGDRLTGMREWAGDGQPWEVLTFDQFGLRTRLAVKVRRCLYYGVTHERAVTVVLTRDLGGERPDSMFYSTDAQRSPREILDMYACRWAAEVTYRDAKQLLGFADPANRTEQAVKRTAPMALVLYSLVVVWAQRGGSEWVRCPERPWYPDKAEPSFADLLTAVRRASWTDYLGGAVGPDAPEQERVANLLDFASQAA